MKEKNLDLVHTLAECIYMCNYCFNSCLEEEDVKMMKECIKLDRDCAEICSTALSMVHAGSDFKRELLILCKNICNDCAAECERHQHHYEHCKECAEACRKCVEVCSNYLNDYNDGVC